MCNDGDDSPAPELSHCHRAVWRDGHVWELHQDEARAREMKPQIPHRRLRGIEHKLDSTLYPDVRKLGRGEGRERVEGAIEVGEIMLQLRRPVGKGGTDVRGG